MREVTPPLPLMSSWCGASLHTGTLTWHYYQAESWLYKVSCYIVYSAYFIKCKVISVLNETSHHEDIWSGGIAPSIILATWWRRIFSFTPWPLYPRERAPSAYWIGDWVGTRALLDAVEKNLLYIPGIEPLFFGRPVRSLVITVTELS
jgi:hypothetical protein